MISDLPELFLNYAGTILFIIGAVSFFIYKKWKHPFFLPLLLMTFLYITYHLFELSQMDAHQYYMLPCVLILVVVMSCGAKLLWEKKQIILLVIILIAQPVLACIRILPARWLNKNKAVPIELFDPKMRNELIKATPDNDLCLAGPDESGCIYFYYLHKKGFGYELINVLENKISHDTISYLNDCIQHGAKYIYTTDSTILQNPKLKPFLAKQIKQVGNFRVIELRK